MPLSQIIMKITGHDNTQCYIKIMENELPSQSITSLITPKHKLIGHRVARGLRPENSLVGFQFVHYIGLNWVELDVRLTKCQN